MNSRRTESCNRSDSPTLDKGGVRGGLNTVVKIFNPLLTSPLSKGEGPRTNFRFRISDFRLNQLLILSVAIPMLVASATFSEEDLLSKANEYYQLRENKEDLQKAIEYYDEALKTDPKNYEAAWRLAKARWYEGNFSGALDRKSVFTKGVEAGKRAVEINPNGCLGHFWYGVNVALQAETSGMFEALGLIDTIKSEMKRTLELDPNCECGGPQRVLGKLYAKIPFFKGGSKSKAISYLNESLGLCANDTQSRIFLAEVYIDDGKKSLAMQQLKLVLKQEPDPNWVPETRANQKIAEKMLSELKVRR
jgi:tetratricopeptide (TPR) repeat protein